MRGDYRPDVILAFDEAKGVCVMMPMAGKYDSLASAVYHFVERRESSGKWLYRLHHIEEFLPPVAPQERTFSDEKRLPMMDEHGFSVRLEAEQREREWREWESRQ